LKKDAERKTISSFGGQCTGKGKNLDKPREKNLKPKKGGSGTRNEFPASRRGGEKCGLKFGNRGKKGGKRGHSEGPTRFRGGSKGVNEGAG